jgi:hypothetical protein
MSQVPLCLVSFTCVSFLLGNVLGAAPALGASLTRQEFEGDFSLVNASPLLEDNLPGASEYSGFVVYSEDGTLRDWEVNVNQLNLNLNPDATEEPIPATVSFELSSASNWNLVVDFGIAFDAPRYTVERSLSEISLSGEVGLAGGYVYTDSAANITLSTSSIPVPEPSFQLGLLFAAGALAIFRKASETKA